MTVIVGVRCSDGLIVAADGAATMGMSHGINTAQQRTVRKLAVQDGRFALGFSGNTSIGQMVVDAVSEGIRGNTLKTGEKIGKAMWTVVEPEMRKSTTVAELTGQQHRRREACMQLIVVADLCTGNGNVRSLQLIQFDDKGSPDPVREDLPFVSLGSGQPLADPFLCFVRRLLWPATGMPNLAQGILGAYWALRHVIDAAPSGVGGEIQIVEVVKTASETKARELSPDEISSHEEAAADLERHIREWRHMTADNPSPIPAVPAA